MLVALMPAISQRSLSECRALLRHQRTDPPHLRKRSCSLAVVTPGKRHSAASSSSSCHTGMTCSHAPRLTNSCQHHVMNVRAVGRVVGNGALVGSPRAFCACHMHCWQCAAQQLRTNACRAFSVDVQALSHVAAWPCNRRSCMQLDGLMLALATDADTSLQGPASRELKAHRCNREEMGRFSQHTLHMTQAYLAHPGFGMVRRARLHCHRLDPLGNLGVDQIPGGGRQQFRLESSLVSLKAS